jgi:hypothetical protein
MAFVTPKSLHDIYRNLNVATVDGEVVQGIDVHEYRWNKSGETDATMNCIAGIAHFTSALKPKIRKNGKAAAGGEYDVKLTWAGTPIPQPWSFSTRRPACFLEFEDMGKPQEQSVTERVNVPALTECFYGKGSPDAIREVLRLAAAFNLFGKPYKGSMNAYCDSYIGLDCSGFVSNYLRANGKTIDAMNTGTGTYRTTAKANNRSAISAVDVGDIMVWSGDHIAAINAVRPIMASTPRQMDEACIPTRGGTYRPATATAQVGTEIEVVESAKARLDSTDAHTDGLNCTWYTIVKQNSNGSFQVKRQQMGMNEFTVWIAPYTAF